MEKIQKIMEEEAFYVWLQVGVQRLWRKCSLEPNTEAVTLSFTKRLRARNSVLLKNEFHKLDFTEKSIFTNLVFSLKLSLSVLVFI